MSQNTIHTETVAWKLSNGNEASVTVSLVRDITTLGHDDHMGRITRDNGLKITVEGRAAGHGVVGNSYDTEDVPEAYRVKGFAATVGKLAVPSEVAPRIEAALAACETHPEYAAQVAKRAAAAQRVAADDAMARRIYGTA